MRSASDRIAFAIAVFIVLTFAGCRQPLPEQDSYAGQLYLRRCGQQCHRAYNPHAMTAAMWEIEIPKMEAKMRQNGLPPLAPEQRQVIVDYLERNAGQQ